MSYQATEIKKLVEESIAKSQVAVQDLTGTADHYRVIVLAPCFAELSLIKRHQMVNEALKEPLKGPIHALTIEAYTEAEWQKLQRDFQRPQDIKF